MPSVLVRNLSEETHLALKRRAAKSGKSAQAEIREILDEAVREEPEVGFGTRLHRTAMEHGGWDLEIKRNQEPAGSAIFE